ncbi:hypothetical protein AGMMS50229_16750 [Campylobacterota bacterium]|nr:hypothetical protein AGMMS50229_16750 [Campylobacterota bacterium]
MTHLDTLSPKIWRRSQIGKYLRLIPRKKQLIGSWLHKKLGDRFLRFEYWEARRDLVAKGFAIGCFWAMIPMPFQMIPSALFAVILGANIPLALLAVWVTNPFTHPFIVAFQLWLGELIIGGESSLSILKNEGVWALLQHAPLPLLTGVLITAVVWTIVGYFLAIFAYDFIINIIVKSYKRRRETHANND